VTTVKEISRQTLLRRGFALEYVTLGRDAVGIMVLAVAALSARSVALAGFGLDSLIEIGCAGPSFVGSQQALAASRPSR
jgi:hypothetical protein